MNWQDLTVYCIVSGCILLIIIRFIRQIRQVKRGTVHCAGCPLETQCKTKPSKKTSFSKTKDSRRKANKERACHCK